ncbi:mechanosensitive ion channel domain-containing protein [Aliikangiella maris]|uniref:Small-conductance mechanosensitive channel n=2 Tax=Aliikangiella maris TaxID=3162458 RepID=A0ABV2BPS9_9GAMM
MFESLTSALVSLPFSLLDYLVIGMNLLVFLFAGYILNKNQRVKNRNNNHHRMTGLRAINLVLFLIYAVTGLVELVFSIEISHLQQISQTGLTILVAYIIYHYLQSSIIKRFGKNKEIDGEIYHSESYASEIIGLIGLILVGSIALLIIINIWNLNSWLQTTSVLGGILLILFAAREYFLGDMINGLIMHYNDSIEAGAVIRVKQFDILGVVIQITLTQTKIRDLVQKHEISISNSKLRNAIIETISNSSKKGFKDYLDFKIGYDQSPEQVETFLLSVWTKAIEQEIGLNKDTQPKVCVIDNGDHAVTWRLLYYVNNPYRILEARNHLQTTAFDLSRLEKIGLNTPVTHQILSGTVN